MPTLPADVRPSGVNLMFRPGDPAALLLEWPTGFLTGRTWASTLGATTLDVQVVGDDMTVTADSTDTTTVGLVTADWVLRETTAGINVDRMIGRWSGSEKPSRIPGGPLRVIVDGVAVEVSVSGAGIGMAATHDTAANLASLNPTLPAGAFGAEDDTGLVKVGPGTWNSLPYLNAGTLVADDPAEVDLDTIGIETTIALTELVARTPDRKVVAQYYWSTYATSSGAGQTQNRLVYVPTRMAGGTLDRLGIEVSTAAATATARVGIYTDNGGVPGSLIAEGTTGADTYPFDCATTGVRTAVISAVLPVNGIYWLACVTQTAAGVSVQGGSNTAAQIWTRVPLGTSPPSGTNSNLSVTQSGVTGALPSTAGTVNAGQDKVRWHFRYSA